jgi:excinuclease ABC subunit A
MGSIDKYMGELGFMQITCPDCGGIRYSSEILKVLYKGKSISDVLNMSISDAAKLFAEEGRIAFMLQTLERTGLGYLRCGQAVSTLSGGEAQRVKLAEELGRQRKGNILYILDEPTTGLSFHDTAMLLALLEQLRSQGNSILIIEHDPNVLNFCDYTIELGPGGGNEGGEVISCKPQPNSRP